MHVSARVLVHYLDTKENNEIKKIFVLKSKDTAEIKQISL